jgi:hypothetical protein
MRTSGLAILAPDLRLMRDVTYLRYDQAPNLTDAQSPGGTIVVTLQ